MVFGIGPLLKDKVAVITGASSGIGRSAAKLFAAHGAKLVIAARGEQALHSLEMELRQEGAAVAALAGDVRHEDFANAVVELAASRFGGLDVAFNNAGTLGTMGSTLELGAADWEHTLQTNLTSAFYAAKYQLPKMLERGSGSLIFTSTFVGYTAGFAGMAAYAASKAGLIGLTQALAVEFGPRGIRVNALLPGGTDTPMGRQVASSPEAVAFVRGLHALKRIAAPEEIARSALYLASDLSSFTTGSALLVDGGVSVQKG